MALACMRMATLEQAEANEVLALHRRDILMDPQEVAQGFTSAGNLLP